MGIFSKQKENRTSPENPSTSLSNPDAWLWEAFGSSQNGVTVNIKTALSVSALWAAVGRRSRTIASLSCKVHRRTDLGSEPDTKHPLYMLLNRQPHPLYSSYTFFQTLVTNLDLYGNSYAEIVRDNSGFIKKFEIIEPLAVKDIQETDKGNYFYIIERVHPMKGQEKRAIPIGNIIHLKGMSLTGILGIDPINTHKDTLGGGLAATQYGRAFFENNAHIGYAVEVPMSMSNNVKDTFLKYWAKTFATMKNAFKRPMILDGGTKLHPLKMTPQDSQMIESKKQVVDEISRITDVPPHMLGSGERFTFSSVEVMVTDFVKFGIRNTLRQIEQEFENKCLSRQEKEDREFEIRFNIDSLLEGDTTARVQKLESEIKWGIITKNEAREKNGYNKVEGGDVFLSPLNMTKVAEGEEPVEQPQNNNENEE